MDYVAYDEPYAAKQPQNIDLHESYPVIIDYSENKSMLGIVATCVLLTLGSGSVVNASNTHVSNNGLLPALYINIDANLPAEVPVSSISDRILVLKNTFNLTISDIAKVLDLQRPTIYQWMKGSAVPRDCNVLKLNKLYELALSLKSGTQALTRQQITTPLEGGATVLELLQDEAFDRVVLEKHIQRLLDVSRPAQAKISLASSLAEKGFSKINKGMQSDISIGSRVD